MRSTLTITAAAAHQRLTTPAFVRRVIETDEADPAIEAWIDAASAVVARLVAAPETAFDPFPLARQTYSETFRLDEPQPFVALSRKPVASVSSIAIAGAAQDAATFELRPGEGLIERLSAGRYSTWPSGVVQVAYAAGFVLDGGGRNVPLALEMAAARLIQYLVAQDSGCVEPALKSESFPGIGTLEYDRALLTLQGGVDATVRDLVAPYAFVFPA